MPELFGQASWPGCLDFISCSYSYGHGTAPGVVTLVVCERDMKLAATYGDLKLSDGTNLLILKDCKLSEVSSAGAGRYTLSILDRRWLWEFTSISGQYNRRDNKNKIIPWQIGTLEHLALACKRAMGENDDIGALPKVNNEDLPAVDWVFANAAQALTELVESFGCRVVFRPWENDTTICKAGVGDDLPDLDYESYTPSIDLPEKPSKLAIVGGEVAYTCAFALEAVGIEPNGEIKPIDELSYKPAAGWGVSPPPYFPNLTIPEAAGLDVFFPGIKVAALTRNEYIALAKSCVYKWYRITLNPLAGDKFKQPWLDDAEFKDFEMEPGTGKRLSIGAERYFKLLGGILTTKRDEIGATLVDPPRVHGVFNRGAANYWTNTAKTESLTEGISIDSERGLVKFDRYMFKLNPTAASLSLAIFAHFAGGAIDPWRIGPAELVLVCSCSVRDSVTHQFERTQRLRALDWANTDLTTKEKIIHREEIQLIKYAEFDASTWQASRLTDNSEEVNAAANRYLDGAEAEYQFVQSATRKYAGILATNPDGALQQFTYEVGGGNAPMTTISRNSEHVSWMPSWKAARGGQKLKVIVDMVPQPAGWGRFFSGDKTHWRPQ